MQRPLGELAPVDISASVVELSGRQSIQEAFQDAIGRKRAGDGQR